jgi:hypothetical protein
MVQTAWSVLNPTFLLALFPLCSPYDRNFGQRHDIL